MDSGVLEFLISIFNAFWKYLQQLVKDNTNPEVLLEDVELSKKEKE